MTQQEMNILVPEKLSLIEREMNIKILHAVESGSRAWGFESPDSDFDVRFIYKRPIDEYLSLKKTRDVIELPVNKTWDVSGWDLDKTLRLLQKSNPSIYEWFSSPICYRRTSFADRIKPLLEEYFSPARMLYHYSSMAHNNNKNIQGDTVKLKRYLYILRPALACLWVIEYDSVPPIRFAELAEKLLPPNLRASVDYILAEKMKAPENHEIPRMYDIEDFIAEAAERTGKCLAEIKHLAKGWDSLNRFFVQEISRD